MATGGGSEAAEEPAADGWALSLIERSLSRLIAAQCCCHGTDDAKGDATADASIFPYLEAVLTDDDDAEADGGEDDEAAVLELMRAYVPSLEAASDADLLGWLGDCRRELAAAAAANEEARSRRLSSRGRSSESSTISELSGVVALCGGEASSATETEAPAEPPDSAEALERLRALFPDACTVGLHRRLAESGGDLQAAVDVCLEPAGAPPACPKPPCACSPPVSAAAAAGSSSGLVDGGADRQQVKGFIMRRFENYELPAEGKSHRPEVRFDEKPRLTRYLDGRVVAQNGARYVEIKDERAEEIRKATTVCLKPARKYRFH